MAALGLTTFLLASAGEHIVPASSLYGGTYTYPTHPVERRGVTTRRLTRWTSGVSSAGL